MSIKTIIVTVCTLFAMSLSGQKRGKEPAEPNHIKGYNQFFLKACFQGSDTLLTRKDSVVKYKVIFSSQGKYADTDTRFSRTSSIPSIKQESGFVDVVGLDNITDSLRESVYLGKRYHQPVSTCPLPQFWNATLKDSMVNIESRPPNWASCVTAKELRFKNAVIKEIPTMVISYSDGKYLIIDMQQCTYIGDAVNYGTVKTYYLESVK